MIRTIFSFAFASTLALAATPTLAGGKPTFVVSARDGYGVAECLTRGDACSVQVANAWCAAQGYHHASDLQIMPGQSGRTFSEAIAITCDN